MGPSGDGLGSAKVLEGAARLALDSKRFLAAAAAANARAQLEIRKVELAAAEGRLAEAMGVPAQEE